MLPDKTSAAHDDDTHQETAAFITSNNVSRRSKTNAVTTQHPNPKGNRIRSSWLSSAALRSRRRHIQQQQALNGEEPFHVIVLNVGSTLLLICVVIYLLIMVSTSRSFSFPAETDVKRDGTKARSATTNAFSNLQYFQKSSQKWDPYGISDQYLRPNQIPHPRDTIDFGSLLHLFLPQATLLRKEFAGLYGGRSSARAMLQRGLQAISNSIVKNDNSTTSASTTLRTDNHPTLLSDDSGGVMSLAQRLQHAAQTKGSFRILVTGSSAAAGKGNAPSQSYAAVLEQYLTSACAALGVSLVIQNAAVEANSEFPWTWCLDNHVTSPEKHSQTSHLHPSIDVIVWDFEASSNALPAFEAFLRRASTVNSKSQSQQLSPLFMFRVSSSFSERHISLLQSYAQAGVLVDTLLLNVDRAAQPFLLLPESKRPPGLSSWLDFGGANNNAMSSITKTGLLSVQQHELVAWLMTMRFLSALEWIAADSIVAPSSDEAKLLSPLTLQPPRQRGKQSLPPPITAATSQWHYSWTPLVLGVPNENQTWTLSQTQCRTSFDSTTLPSNLQDLILSGTVGDGNNATLLLRPKSAMFYNAGWVLDLDPLLRRDKRLQQDGSNNNDLADMKKAYYGVSTSGTLRMFVPIVVGGKGVDHPDKTSKRKKKTTKNKDDTLPNAKDYVEPVVVCHFALTHRPDGCQFPGDLAFRVDGMAAEASLIPLQITTNANNTCVVVKIPSGARLTRRKSYEHHNVKRPTTDEDVNGKQKTRKDIDDTSIEDTFGILLEIEVSNSRLTWDKGPCSIAQVVWQTKEARP